jgi:hypothetical protein
MARPQYTAMEFIGIQENFECTQGAQTAQATYEHKGKKSKVVPVLI